MRRIKTIIQRQLLSPKHIQDTSFHRLLFLFCLVAAAVVVARTYHAATAARVVVTATAAANQKNEDNNPPAIISSASTEASHIFAPPDEKFKFTKALSGRFLLAYFLSILYYTQGSEKL